MMFWYGDGMSGWGYALMTIGMVVFWALVIAGIVALVHYLGQSQQPSTGPSPTRTPEQLLAERFARGDIDAEEYHERHEILRGGAGVS